MERSLSGEYLSRLSRWSKRRRVQNVATLGLVLLGPILAVLTFSILGPLDQGATSPSLRLILLADLVYVLVVAALVLARVMRMIAARRARLRCGFGCGSALTRVRVTEPRMIS